jgi:hypothetical protein
LIGWKRLVMNNTAKAERGPMANLLSPLTGRLAGSARDRFQGWIMFDPSLTWIYSKL